MILVNKKYFTLFFIFVGYLILSLFLVYDIDNITYLHSDEQTFHDFALNVSKLDFKLWWAEIQNCYVGIFPNSNIYFTVSWYSLIYKFSSLIGINGSILLRLVNVFIGFYTVVIVSNYIEKFSEIKLSNFYLICISFPFLFFSTSLLRDNYVLLFTFLGLIHLREKKSYWLSKVILYGLLVFLFRHSSLGIYLILLFYFKFKNNFFFIHLSYNYFYCVS